MTLTLQLTNKKAYKKLINSWAMYDWSNSVYNLVITSTIFPIYYTSMTTKTVNGEFIDTVNFLGINFKSAALYNYALGFAYLIIAFLSPVLSSIADYKNDKKMFMKLFTYIGGTACSLLFFFTQDTIGLGLLFFILGAIGYCGGLVFYNAFLPEIAPPEDRDRVSARGFSFGYVGSVLLQLICFYFVLAKPLGMDAGMGSRISFLLVGLWWIGFAQIPFKALKERRIPKNNDGINIFSKGFIELRSVWNQVQKMPVLKSYLAAFFFYGMGVQTVMLAAALFGSQELRLSEDKLIISILLIQLVAIAGAFSMARLSKAIGNLKTFLIVVAIWIGICIAAYYTVNEYQFYALAFTVGLVMGGIQSLSRSTYSKIMPETVDTASFFSFYDATEKIAIVIGMFTFGFIQEISGSMRNSILILMVFFSIGLIYLFRTLLIQKRLS